METLSSRHQEKGANVTKYFPNSQKCFLFAEWGEGGRSCNLGALQREQKIAAQETPSPVACAAGLMGKSRLMHSLLH